MAMSKHGSPPLLRLRSTKVARELLQKVRDGGVDADADIIAYPRWSSLTNQSLVDGFETIAAYNIAAERGEDPEFHKYSKWIKPLMQGPYAAFDLSFGRAVYTGFTLGGLTVSPDGDTPVPGAGGGASNIAQDSAGHASGPCLGPASFFGRRAGHHAATHGE